LLGGSRNQSLCPAHQETAQSLAAIVLFTGPRPIAGIAPPADAIGAKRVILTHMGPDMFAHLDEVTEEIAEDGKIVEA